MGVPIELIGAWRRSGLIWKGQRVVDYCDAIWLQTPEWFVDMRLLMDPAAGPTNADVPGFFYRNSCFAGHTTWEAPQITWNHEIDWNLAPRSRLDSNPLAWADGVVLECGTSTVDGETYPFIEEWLRTTDDDVTWSASGDDHHARIEVGRWAVELADERPSGQFVATRYELTDSGWREYGVVRA